MTPDSPDTVLLDEHPAPRPAPPPSPPSPPPPPAPPLDGLPERTWFEKPPFWVSVVVLMLLSIPMLVECSSRRGKVPVPPVVRPNAAASLPAAAASAPAAVAAPVVGTEGGRAEGAPPRATPPSVVNPRPNAAEPNKQMVTKCLENGRVIYTQTGACTGSMVPVPIDTEKNLVDSPAPQLNRNVAKPPPVAGSRPSR